jgi:cation diffusion facilitator CzcD-associated flavoprotein CzcO
MAAVDDNEQADNRLATVVIGAGQAGLSAAYHLRRLGFAPWADYVVLDSNDRPGGAWQHRWPSLTMADVNGVTALPGLPVPQSSPSEPARDVVAAYFADYENRFELPVLRPVGVDRVADADTGDGSLVVRAGDLRWRARTIINATGTWDRPFWPSYPGMADFAGRQLHVHDYPGPEPFANSAVLVVGGGISAVQILAELVEVNATTTWVTRRPAVWRSEPFDREAGRQVVAAVDDRVRRGLPPSSVVANTGLIMRAQERRAAEHGAYRRQPMFSRLIRDGAQWIDGHTVQADVIIWATGFRPDIGHLAPLGLRTAAGGIRVEDTTATADPRVQLVGYGWSASTIGGNRAGRTAALQVRRQLAETPAAVAA